MSWATDRAAADVARTLAAAGEMGRLRRALPGTYNPDTRSVTAADVEQDIVLVPSAWSERAVGDGVKVRVRRLVVSPPGFAIEPKMVIVDAAGAAYTVLSAESLRLKGEPVAFIVEAAGGAG